MIGNVDAAAASAIYASDRHRANAVVVLILCQ